MTIEHAAIYVNDLEKARDFFVKYFGAECSNMYHNKKTGFMSYFLSFDSGARLEIMTRPMLENLPKSMLRTGLAHIAFKVGSRERVDELTGLLARDGYKVLSEPRVTGDGYYESVISGIEDNIIELTE